MGGFNKTGLLRKLNRELGQGADREGIVRYLSGLKDAGGLTFKEFAYYSDIVNKYNGEF